MSQTEESPIEMHRRCNNCNRTIALSRESRTLVLSCGCASQSVKVAEKIPKAWQ